MERNYFPAVFCTSPYLDFFADRFVGKARLSPDWDCDLKDSDQISFGDQKFTVRYTCNNETIVEEETCTPQPKTAMKRCLESKVKPPAAVKNLLYRCHHAARKYSVLITAVLVCHFCVCVCYLFFLFLCFLETGSVRGRQHRGYQVDIFVVRRPWK